MLRAIETRGEMVSLFKKANKQKCPNKINPQRAKETDYTNQGPKHQFSLGKIPYGAVQDADRGIWQNSTFLINFFKTGPFCSPCRITGL